MLTALGEDAARRSGWVPAVTLAMLLSGATATVAREQPAEFDAAMAQFPTSPTRPRYEALVTRKLLRLDNELNTASLASREQVALILDKAKATGFNVVVPGVRNSPGSAVCPSALTSQTRPAVHGEQPADFDQLAIVVEEAHKRGLHVHAALAMETDERQCVERILSSYDVDGVIFEHVRDDAVAANRAGLPRGLREKTIGLRVAPWPEHILGPGDALTSEPVRREPRFAPRVDYLVPEIHCTAVLESETTLPARSVETGVALARRVTNEEVPLAPALHVADFDSEGEYEAAIRLCLENTGGVMIFSHALLEKSNRWEATMRGLEATRKFLE